MDKLDWLIIITIPIIVYITCYYLGFYHAVYLTE